MPDPNDVDFHEETDSDPCRRPRLYDDRGFDKVEKWTRDGMEVDSLLYAANKLSKAVAAAPTTTTEPFCLF